MGAAEPGTNRAEPRGNTARAAARHVLGFSLIEILVVITLIGLLMTFGFTAMQGAMEKGRVSKCQNNLHEIGQAMVILKDRNRGKWPREDGIRFLLSLHKHKQITGRGTEVFLCPGTADSNDVGDGEFGSAYEDWESITSDTISYAGRDMSNYPLRGASEGESVIAADDNEFGANHKTTINILYGSGAVVPFDVLIDGADIVAQYPEYEDPAVGFPVGPESPYEPLQVLRID